MITERFLNELEVANEDAVIDDFITVRHDGAAKRVRMLAEIGQPPMGWPEVKAFIATERAKLGLAG